MRSFLASCIQHQIFLCVWCDFQIELLVTHSREKESKRPLLFKERKEERKKNAIEGDNGFVAM
jgi:hypothetical protein